MRSPGRPPCGCGSSPRCARVGPASQVHERQGHQPRRHPVARGRLLGRLPGRNRHGHLEAAGEVVSALEEEGAEPPGHQGQHDVVQRTAEGQRHLAGRCQGHLHVGVEAVEPNELVERRTRRQRARSEQREPTAAEGAHPLPQLGQPGAVAVQHQAPEHAGRCPGPRADARARRRARWRGASLGSAHPVARSSDRRWRPRVSDR